MARKRQQEESIDTIFLRVVPRSITGDDRIVYGTPDYWTRIEAEVNTFSQALPSGLVGTPTLERFENEGAQLCVYAGSSCELKVGFSPSYPYAIERDNEGSVQEVKCPTVDIYFKVTSAAVATTILQAALKQFFMYQSDDLDETLAVTGIHEGRKSPVDQDLSLLKRYLPKNTIVKAVTDVMTSVGEASYTI